MPSLINDTTNGMDSSEHEIENGAINGTVNDAVHSVIDGVSDVTANGTTNGATNGTTDSASTFADTSIPKSLPIHTGAASVKRYPTSSISIIVVGAGIGGLLAALECWRKGHDVRVLEKNRNEVMTGDVFTLGPSAIQNFRHWPDMAREIEAIGFDALLTYRKTTGELIAGPELAPFNTPEFVKNKKGPHCHFSHSRPRFYKMLAKQAERVGIRVDLNQNVQDYYEDTTAGKAGVVLEGGDRYEADLVIAADGARTRSWKLVGGKKVEAKSSGYAIFRTSYDSDIAYADSVVKEQFGHHRLGQPSFEFWSGPGSHCILICADNFIAWNLTHKDDGSSRETWQDVVSTAEVLATVEKLPGWSESFKALIKASPEGSIIDWKLMMRDPQEQWTSPGGRIVQVGDSAHSLLPSSGNGATQAMEDGFSLATCLQLGGKNNVPWATRVHNKLRFERVSCCQLLGFVIRETLHAQEEEAKTPGKGEAPRIPKVGNWILAHDPEQYAYENFGTAFNHLVSGAPFKNTNIPPGYVHVPWTMADLSKQAAAGKSLASSLSGDWS